jgi:hypothetical protein
MGVWNASTDVMTGSKLLPMVPDIATSRDRDGTTTGHDCQHKRFSAAAKTGIEHNDPVQVVGGRRQGWVARMFAPAVTE